MRVKVKLSLGYQKGEEGTLVKGLVPRLDQYIQYFEISLYLVTYALPSLSDLPLLCILIKYLHETILNRWASFRTTSNTSTYNTEVLDVSTNLVEHS